MDPAERALAVKERMADLKAQHLPLTKPCSECRFGPIDGSGLGICEHYAHWEIAADPVRGRRRGSVQVSTMTARSADGLCGPEGLLFEPYSRRGKIILWFLRGPSTKTLERVLLVWALIAAFVLLDRWLVK